MAWGTWIRLWLVSVLRRLCRLVVNGPFTKSEVRRRKIKV